MKMGRAIGSVASTRKDPKLQGLELLIVEKLAPDLEPEGGCVVTVDLVGAGASDVVLYATGSAARQTEQTRDRPVDAVIMAILDQYDVGGRTVRLA